MTAEAAPRVDFYLVAGDAAARDAFCCRLAEKAYREGYRVHLRTADREAAERLNDRLWTFRAGSFVPHALLGEADGEPVTLGEGLPAEAEGVLVNLGVDLPEGWQRWRRIAEVVTDATEPLDRARERFRVYRDAGREPAHHRIGEAS